jgi:hypothetical protein
MTLLNPLALAALAAVAAAAVAALLGARRRVIQVSSLRLWQRAIDSAPAGKLRRGAIPASWWLLLAGALAAVGAMSRPVWRGQAPRGQAAVVPPATATPDATLDAVAARVLPQRASQLMVAIRNHLPSPRTAPLTISVDGAAGETRQVDLAESERKAVFVDIPPGAARISVSI